MWDSWVVFWYLWGTFSLLAFKVIWRSFGVLATFPISKKHHIFYKSNQIYQTSPQLSSQWSSQKYVWDFLKFENVNIFFHFLEHGTLWEWQLQKATPPTNRSKKLSNLSWIFLPTLRIFEILSFRFLMIFFRKFQIHQCSLWRNQKPLLSGKRAVVEQNGVKFGPRM